jgi:hypothetical protein
VLRDGKRVVEKSETSGNEKRAMSDMAPMVSARLAVAVRRGFLSGKIVIGDDACGPFVPDPSVGFRE